MSFVPPLTVIICATPRTGSTLLCAMLAASGVGGRPESWYRAEDRDEYVQEWSLDTGPDGYVRPTDFLAGAIRAGSGPDGTFGLRLQAKTLQPFLTELQSVFPEMPQDRACMQAAFGPCHFIHIRRHDRVAQAVSRLKAEQTQVWHLDGTEPRAAGAAIYNASQINDFIAEAASGNLAWEHWFHLNGITPIPCSYEDLSADPDGCVRGLLSAIGIAVPDEVSLTVSNRRMADGVSAAWAARFAAEQRQFA